MIKVKTLTGKEIDMNKRIKEPVHEKEVRSPFASTHHLNLVL